jgi:hypothetical protein
VEVQPEILNILFLRKLYIDYMEWGQVSLRVVNVTWTYLDALAFILHFCNHFCIASRLVCSLCEAITGSMSMANTTLSSAKLAVVDCAEGDSSAVYNRYNNSPRTLTWGTPAFTGESSVYSVSTFVRKCLLCK